jgi:hypothetical protein
MDDRLLRIGDHGHYPLKETMGILDTVQGVISRRVLLNFRIDPEALERVLPKPFKPKLYKGVGIGGVCMIRFKELRPKFLPKWLGLRSENAAHRIAVQWEQDGNLCEGVYIPRRDTNSIFNSVLGGRVFPGIFNRSTFDVDEQNDNVCVSIVRRDGGNEITFRGRVADEMPKSSVFPSLDDAANFFSLGATGYSATKTANHYHGMDLDCITWSIHPMVVDTAESCFFGDLERFPQGTVEVDCALLMNDVDHKWHSRPDLYLDSTRSCLTTKRQTG